MDILQPHQQRTFKATKPMLRLSELQQALVHSSTVAATEAAGHFEALIPAVGVVVADSRVVIGALVATAPGLLPVSLTMQVRVAEHRKPQMLARRRQFTVKPQHTMQRILSDRLGIYKSRIPAEKRTGIQNQCRRLIDHHRPVLPQKRKSVSPSS